MVPDSHVPPRGNSPRAATARERETNCESRVANFPEPRPRGSGIDREGAGIIPRDPWGRGRGQLTVSSSGAVHFRFACETLCRPRKGSGFGSRQQIPTTHVVVFHRITRMGILSLGGSGVNYDTPKTFMPLIPADFLQLSPVSLLTAWVVCSFSRSLLDGVGGERLDLSASWEDRRRHHL